MKKPPKIRYRELLTRPPAPAESTRAPAPAPRADAAELPPPGAEAAAVSALALPAEPAPVYAELPSPLVEQTDATRTTSGEYLVFRAGHELFALPLDTVDEAIDVDAVQPIPQMDGAMLGVLSLRGALVPLYAAASALGVADDSRAAALVFVTARGRVALAVDDVEDVMSIATEELQRSPMDFGDGVLIGVARRGADLIGVLDAAALVAACRPEAAMETA